MASSGCLLHPLLGILLIFNCLRYVGMKAWYRYGKIEENFDTKDKNRFEKLDDNAWRKEAT
jgi:hypothetical protein